MTQQTETETTDQKTQEETEATVKKVQEEAQAAKTLALTTEANTAKEKALQLEKELEAFKNNNIKHNATIAALQEKGILDEKGNIKGDADARIKALELEKEAALKLANDAKAINEKNANELAILKRNDAVQEFIDTEKKKSGKTYSKRLTLALLGGKIPDSVPEAILALEKEYPEIAVPEKAQGAKGAEANAGSKRLATALERADELTKGLAKDTFAERFNNKFNKPVA